MTDGKYDDKSMSQIELKKNKKRKREEKGNGPKRPGSKRVAVQDEPPDAVPSTSKKKTREDEAENMLMSNHNGFSKKGPKNSSTPEISGYNNKQSKFGDGRGGRRPPTSLKEKAKELYQTRKELPIFGHADEIRRDMCGSDVMLLIGETGSGKSTQVPQFLVDEKWCRPVNVRVPISTITTTSSSKTDSSSTQRTEEDVTVGGCIAITQPRRVAAVSLAKRVAEEMGTPLGSSSPASKVGYSVRFDSSTSPNTRVKYLTDGMLLQEMLTDPWLRKYSAVVVDEVHERGVNVDLLLGFLRNMVSGGAGAKEARGGVPLKVIVMSATADMASLKGFFEEGFKQNVLPQKDAFDAADGDDGSEWSGISSNGNPPKEKENKKDMSKEITTQREVAVCHIKGRQYPVKTIYTPEPVQDFVDAALNTIFRIHHKEPLPGDILVFLTGQETVESLESLVNDYATNMDSSLPKVQVLPLFAALPQAAQQRVFLPTPPRRRKIILATNIAETSVTVPGVRYVVDCGKAKLKQFRSRLGLDSLLVKPISKSAAIQRKGRAGREAPGHCYRLYTEADYLGLEETNTPEILRCDISQAILTMKARGVDDIIGFPFLTRPSREALEKALLQLYSIQALDGSGRISALGDKIAKLPLTAPLGRVLLESTEYGNSCLRDVIDIISCLSVENIFLGTTSEEKKEEAEKARRDLYRREGDHLTMLAAVRSYAAENTDRRAWAERHMVSHRAMQSVMDVRKQLLAQCKQTKLLNADALDSDSDNSNGEKNRESILKSFLTGFATHTARLFPDGSYKTVAGNQTVAIHPSSVLFGRKVEAIMYNEFVFTNRSYARGVSAVQMRWVGEALGA